MSNFGMDNANGACLESIRLQIIQPIVPEYRLALFDLLAERFPAGFRVSASRAVLHGPPAVGVERDYLDISHECISLFRGKLFWQRGLQLWSALRAGDVIVLSGNPRYLNVLRLALAARRKGIGIVWWTQIWSPTSRPYTARLRAQMLKLGHCILVYTEEELVRFRHLLPPNIPVVAAQNTMDISKARTAAASVGEEELERFRSQNHLEHRKLLLYCGRLRSDPPTDVDVALRALARLLAVDKSFLLVVIGDGVELTALKKLAEQLSVNDHVRWIGALYDEDSLALWFRTAMCFVYPGAIGLSLIHAFAHGLPVIAHDVFELHNPEIAALRSGWNGALFRKGDSADLAQSIIGITASEARLSEMRVNAMRTVVESFSLENMAGRFLRAVKIAARRVTSNRAA